MLEIGLFIGLLGSMGFYMIKSSDLSKELKEKRQMHQSEYATLQNKSSRSFQISLAEIPSAKKKNGQVQSANPVEKKIESVPSIVKIDNSAKKNALNNQIDLLTVEITTLEQEIKVNNAKNQEIQYLISARLNELEKLQNELTKLS